MKKYIKSYEEYDRFSMDETESRALDEIYKNITSGHITYGKFYRIGNGGRFYPILWCEGREICYHNADGDLIFEKKSKEELRDVIYLSLRTTPSQFINDYESRHLED